MKHRKGTWKTILIAFVLLGVVFSCTAPAAERESPRGTLPSAAVSQRAETNPPTAEPASASPAAKETPAPTPEPTSEPAPESTPVGRTYILNTNTHKFHVPSCSSVSQMKSSNKREFTGTRDEVISMGYAPCGRCHP